MKFNQHLIYTHFPKSHKANKIVINNICNLLISQFKIEMRHNQNKTKIIHSSNTNILKSPCINITMFKFQNIETMLSVHTAFLQQSKCFALEMWNLIMHNSRYEGATMGGVRDFDRL